MASLCGGLVFDSVSRLIRLLLLGRLLFTHHLSSTHHLCHSPSFAYNLVTHHLSHTTLSHTIFHTRLYHTQLFTHNFFNFPILHHLLCFSFLSCPASTCVAHYWKKLACGVIRSFNLGGLSLYMVWYSLTKVAYAILTASHMYICLWWIYRSISTCQATYRYIYSLISAKIFLYFTLIFSMLFLLPFFADRNWQKCRRLLKKYFIWIVKKGPLEAPLLSVWIVGKKELVPSIWNHIKIDATPFVFVFLLLISSFFIHFSLFCLFFDFSLFPWKFLKFKGWI
jgi:hypothetical protein